MIPLNRIMKEASSSIHETHEEALRGLIHETHERTHGTHEEALRGLIQFSIIHCAHPLKYLFEALGSLVVRSVWRFCGEFCCHCCEKISICV